MLREIEYLKQIQRCCTERQPLDPKHASFLGDGLSRFLAQDCHDLNEAFGLKSPQGGVPWWREEAIRKRNAALCRLAAEYSSERSTAAIVRRIHEEALRYAASAWRFDRKRRTMHKHYAGTRKEYLWRAFKADAHMPLCQRQLRNIVAL